MRTARLAAELDKMPELHCPTAAYLILCFCKVLNKYCSFLCEGLNICFKEFSVGVQSPPANGGSVVCQLEVKDEEAAAHEVSDPAGTGPGGWGGPGLLPGHHPCAGSTRVCLCCPRAAASCCLPSIPPGCWSAGTVHKTAP